MTMAPHVAIYAERIIDLMSDGRERIASEIADSVGAPSGVVGQVMAKLRSEGHASSTNVKGFHVWRMERGEGDGAHDFVAQSSDYKRRIIDRMSDGRERTARELAEVVGCTVHIAGDVLRRLKQEGKASRGKTHMTGIWRLTPEARQ